VLWSAGRHYRFGTRLELPGRVAAATDGFEAGSGRSCFRVTFVYSPVAIRPFLVKRHVRSAGQLSEKRRCLAALQRRACGEFYGRQPSTLVALLHNHFADMVLKMDSQFGSTIPSFMLDHFAMTKKLALLFFPQ
jgi:hypothetical protein